jgi:hypothetical protein
VLFRRDLDLVVGHGRFSLLQHLFELGVGVFPSAPAATVLIVVAAALLATTAQFDLELGHFLLALTAPLAAAGLFAGCGLLLAATSSTFAAAPIIFLVVILVKVELFVVFLLLSTTRTARATAIPVAKRDLVFFLLLVLLFLFFLLFFIFLLLLLTSLLFSRLLAALFASLKNKHKISALISLKKCVSVSCLILKLEGTVSFD